MLQQSLALETMIYDNDQGYFGGLSQYLHCNIFACKFCIKLLDTSCITFTVILL